MKRKRLVVILLSAALLAASVLAYFLFLAPVRRPNIVLITVDALRADYLGVYGHAQDTSPHIDAFAREAIVFANAYCTVPKTSGSFATILTGLHPFFHKTSPIRDYLGEEHLTIAEFLKRHGYETAAIVENANLSKAMKFDQGFASYTEVWKHVKGKAAATPFITRASREFLGRKHSQPFFLWVHYIDTHAPYLPAEDWVRYDGTRKGRDISLIEKKIIVGAREEKQKIMSGVSDENYFVALYEGCVRYVDDEIGKVLETLDRQRFGDDTIVILSSDHGEELGEHNLFFDHGPLNFQSSTRVPLIVRMPGRKPARVDRPVSLMDIFPTVAEDILGEPIPTVIQGISLFRSAPERKLHIFGQASRAVVTSDRNYLDVLPDFAQKLGIATEYCFDLHGDPGETNNLIAANRPQFLLNMSQFMSYLAKNKYPLKRKERRKISEKDRQSLETLGYLN